jgi:hypothetical protein
MLAGLLTSSLQCQTDMTTIAASACRIGQNRTNPMSFLQLRQPWLTMSRTDYQPPAKLFAKWDDTRIVYDAAVSSRLGKKWEAPDTVLSLHNVTTLEKRLAATSRLHNDQTLLSCLNPTLFENKHRQVVFPFLVGESKSDSSSGSFSRIHLQMALVVEESLRIQERLRQMVGASCRWHAGPLVWCLSHRGHDWRMSAGYMRMPPRKGVKIVRPHEYHRLASLTR